MKASMVFNFKVKFVDSQSELLFIIVDEHGASCRFKLTIAEGVEDYLE